MNNDEHIMVDLETLATDDDAAILSIGAAHFDIMTGDILDTFYLNIDLEDSLKHGFKIDPQTIYWWFQQEKAASEALTKEVQDVDVALTKFMHWVKRIDKHCKIWGNGVLFDNNILRRAYKRVGKQFDNGFEYPTGFRNDMDVRTIVQIGKERGINHKSQKREGTYHNALDDAIYQVEFTSRIYRELMTA